jgi:APA family basic amino acid/polyamine antiporter
MFKPYFYMDLNAPIAEAFVYVGLNWAKYVVAVGVIISLLNSLYSGLYPPARITFSMATDGLLFKCFSIVLPRLHSPIVATLTVGFITGKRKSIMSLRKTMMSFFFMHQKTIFLGP